VAAVTPATVPSGPLETEAPDTPALELRDVSIAYRGRVALERIDLEIARGEVIAVVGPSGSGKSSLLRCIGGFLDPVTGSVRIDGGLIADAHRSVAPERRQIGFVFQSYALWPHMTVRENVAYPWRTRRVGPEERGHQADALLSQVGLDGFGERAPETLSGGQRQRVALARGLAGDPRLLLLDEPLSSVDAARRDELQTLIRDVVVARGLTTVIATHDQREAMTLADRVVVLGAGTVAQCASPIELHDHPANGFVARFMGALNVFDIRVSSSAGGRLVAESLDGSGRIIARVDVEVPSPEAVLVARPETIRLTAPGAGDQDGEVIRSVLVDGHSEVRIQLGGFVLRAFETGVPRRAPGEFVGVVLEKCIILPPEAVEPSGAP
jgi:ABC-type Fe3+/spermidine/putrescine transport system ATPase subunit